ncbi:hypothetical protein NUSPORA_01221 [Nucleospora cyclopteri]
MLFETDTVQLCFKKVKNKPMTIIANVKKDQTEALCKSLRKKLGCGGSVDKEKNYVILQGNHVGKLLEQKNILFPGVEVIKIDSI